MKKAAIMIAVVFAVSATVVIASEDAFDTKAAAIHMEKGISFLKSKKYDEAISEFDKAATILPEAEPYYFLGYAYYLKGRTGDEDSRKKAMENFEKAYELDPNYTPSRPLPGPAPAPQVQPPKEPIEAEHPQTQTTGQ